MPKGVRLLAMGTTNDILILNSNLMAMLSPISRDN
jgi:hypothetical protein